MKRALLCACCMCLLLLLGGCTTVVKQTYYTVAGPQGSYLLIDSPEPAELARYTKIEVAPFESLIPEAIDEALVNACQARIVSRLQTDGFFEEVKEVPALTKGGGTDVLVITGKLVDITSDKFPGEKIIGGGNHLIAMLDIKDKSGRTIIKANVRGEAKSVAQYKQEDLAEGMGKGILKILERAFDDSKKKREEAAKRARESED